jgi:hypothetical protein
MKFPASLYGELTGASIQKVQLHEHPSEGHQQELIACESICAIPSLHVTRDPPSLSRLHMLWLSICSNSHSCSPMSTIISSTSTFTCHLQIVVCITQLLHSRRWSTRFATPCRPRLEENVSLKSSTSWRAPRLLRRSTAKALLSRVRRGQGTMMTR